MGRRRYNSSKVLKKIGLRVRQLRHERGWTLEECEEHGWPNWTHLVRVEQGKNITVETMVNLANLFGLSLTELLRDI